MKILIIGGTGPTGSFMVEELLSRGHQVTIYHTGAHEVEFSTPVEHLHGDPRELRDLQRDLGGRSFDAAVNTAGRIRHVIEVLRGRVEKLVAISGMGVYRDLYLGMPVPIPEEAPPGNPFATSCHTLLDLSKIKADLGYRDVVRAEEATRSGCRSIPRPRESWILAIFRGPSTTSRRTESSGGCELRL